MRYNMQLAEPQCMLREIQGQQCACSPACHPPMQTTTALFLALTAVQFVLVDKVPSSSYVSAQASRSSRVAGLRRGWKKRRNGFSLPTAAC